MPPTFWTRHGHWLLLALLVLAVLTQGTGTVRFGDGLELVAVGSRAGVAHPPGYPWFTLLLGASTAFLPGDPYTAALWVGRFAAIGVVFVLALVVRRILHQHGVDERSSLFGSLLFSLAFLFGGALRPTLHVVEVYGFHSLALVTLAALLVFGAGPPSRRALWAAACVQGFALAHHLTALAMLPLTVLAIVEHAHSGDRRSAMLAGATVLALPFAWYASLLVRAPGPGDETLVWGGMQNFGALVQHVTGSEYGTSQFFMADAHTRFTAGGWVTFAGERFTLLATHAGSMFFGKTPAAPYLGLFGGMIAVLGVRAMLRQRRRFTLALLAAIALQVGFVLTYNIADITDYFLGIDVLVFPFFVHGLLLLAKRSPLGREPRRGLAALAIVVPAVLLVLTIPLQASTARPASAPIAARYQSRLLSALPQNAGVITAESGDLFLLWYTRFALEARRDLFVLPANLLDRPWIRSTLPAHDPRREAIAFREGPMEYLQPYVADLRAQVIEPMLAHGPVFTTIRTVEVLEALAQHYEFRMAAELLSREEIAQFDRDGLPRAPSILWELRHRGG